MSGNQYKNLELVEELTKVKDLEFLAKKVVEGFLIGLHKSPFHGFSVEFSEHRLYNPGESTKNLDWKVLARTDKMYVKKYEEETNLRCHIVLDCSPSMYFPVERKDTKISFSVLSIASLIQLLKSQRDAFGITFFSEEIETYLAAKLTSVHKKIIFDTLQKKLEYTNKKQSTNIANTLHDLAERIPRRSMLVLFSDMFETAEQSEEIFEAFKHLKYNNHEVILFHVLHKSLEENFSWEDRPHEFVDMETNETIKLHPHLIQKEVLKNTALFKENIKNNCLKYGIDYVDVDAEKDFYTVLNAYLAKRSKLLK